MGLVFAEPQMIGLKGLGNPSFIQQGENEQVKGSGMLPNTEE